MKRNPYLARLTENYLFPEINMRKRQFLAHHPTASLISLGIGDTTEPLTPSVTQALMEASQRLGTQEGYVGYGLEQGMESLREKIASRIYGNRVDPDEIFISDGAKCDIGRIEMLCGHHVSIAVQDPSYPVYVEGSMIQGVEKIIRMPCLPENGFFPNLKAMPLADLIYICSPNNPTGTCFTRKELEEIVAFAKRHSSFIVFDSAYAHYIQDPSLPKSIFEIEEAKQVAIEIGSFSKLAGFTGVRLGWTVVPKELQYEEGSSLWSDWKRVISTVFNGASIIAQYGGCAILENPGWGETQKGIEFYLQNAHLIRNALKEKGYEVFGGVHAPYLWVRFKEKNSWDVFQYFLEKLHIVTTPGSGFGPGGEGFIRLSAFGRREAIVSAIERIKSHPLFK